MELEIKTQKSKLTIYISKEFRENRVNAKDNFMREDCVPLVVIDYWYISNGKLEHNYLLIRDYEEESSKYKFVTEIKKDGVLDIYGIFAPTKTWFDNYNTGDYNHKCYIEGSTIYEVVNGTATAFTDYTLLKNIPVMISTLDFKFEPRVSIYNLQLCALNYCIDILNSRGFGECWNKNSIDSETIFKRDLVHMALHVIKYLAKEGDIFEIQRIILNIEGCNGLCSGSNKNKIQNGCGCSR